MIKKTVRLLVFINYIIPLLIGIIILSNCSYAIYDQRINLSTAEPKNSDEYHFNKYFQIAIEKYQDFKLRDRDHLEYKLSFTSNSFLSNLSDKVMRESTTLTGNFVVKRNGVTLFKFSDSVLSSYNIKNFSYEAQRIREENRQSSTNTLANSASIKMLLKYLSLNK